MEPVSLEYALDYFQDLLTLSKELLERETRLALESIYALVPLADLPVSISSAKRRKGSTQYFETGVKEDCFDVNGGDNCFTGGVQPKSNKRCARSGRKPLVDKNEVDHSRQSNLLASTRRAHVGKADGGVILRQWAKDYSLRDKENTCVATSPRHITLLGDRKASSPVLVDDLCLVGRNAVPVARKASQQRGAEVGNLVAPRLTRARAKILENAGGNTTIAGDGSPPSKKPRGRRGNSSAISNAPAEKQGNGRQSVIPEVELEGVETIVTRSLAEGQTRQAAALAQQSPVALKRSARANSLSLPAETDENVEENEAIGAMLVSRDDEKDKEAVELEYGTSITSHNAAEKNTGEAPPSSKKSRTPMKNTGPKSTSPTKMDEMDETEVGGRQDVAANVQRTADVHDLVASHIRESPPTKKSKEANGNAAYPLIEKDDSVGSIEMIVARNLNASGPVADQFAMKPTSGQKNGIGMLSSPAHADECVSQIEVNVASFVDLLRSVEMQNKMESIQTRSQSDNALGLRRPGSSTKVTQVDIADHDSILLLSVVPSGVYGSTGLPAEDLVGTEHSEGKRIVARPPVKDGTHNGSRPSSVENDKGLSLSTATPPGHGKELVKREAEVTVPIRPEFKAEEANNVCDSEGHVGQNEPPSLPKSGLGEGNPREFTCSLAERDDNAYRRHRSLAYPLGVHPPEELKKKETMMEATELEYLKMLKQSRNETVKIRPLEFGRNSETVSGFFRRVDCDVSRMSKEGGIRNRPALESLETADLGASKLVPGHPPDEECMHSDSAACQVRKDKQVTRSITAPQFHGQELSRGEIVPDSLELNSNERDHHVGTAALEDIRGGQSINKTTECKVVYDTTSSSPELPHEKAGEGKFAASRARNVAFSEGEEGRKKIVGNLKDRVMDRADTVGVQFSVERQDTDRPSVVGGNTLQVTVLPSFTETSSASDNDRERDRMLMRGGDAVTYQNCSEPVSGSLKGFELCSGKNLTENASDRGNYLRSPVRAGKELIRTTASPQGHRELLFTEEGGAIVSNIVDLDEDKEFNPLKEVGEEEIRDVDAGEVQDWAELGSGCLGDSERSWVNISVDDRSDKEGCIRSPVKAGKDLIRTTASPQGSGEKLFDEETSSMDLGDEEFDRLKETPENETRNVKPGQFRDARRGSSVSCEIGEKVLPHLRFTPGFFDSVTKRHKPKTPCAWGNVRSQLDGEFAEDDTTRGKPASNLEDLDSREDDLMGNSSQDPANEQGLPAGRFHELYRSVIDSDSATCGLFHVPIKLVIVHDMIGASPQCRPKATSLLCDEPEVSALSEIGSAFDWKPQRINNAAYVLSQEWTTIDFSSILVEDQYPDEAVSSFSNPQIAKEGFQIDNIVCQVSTERKCKEELSRIRPISFSTAEQVLAISSLENSPAKDAISALDPSITSIGGATSLQQSVSSDIGPAQVQSTNLITVMKTLVPLTQRPLPSFLPNGKRDVKVKALDAGQAVKCMQEMKDRQKKMLKRSEENVGFAMEKERANKEVGILLQRESVDATKLDGESMPYGDRLRSVGKSVLADCSNSKRLFSSVAKFRGATATKLRIEKKIKKHEEEIRRREEEVKKKDAKILACRQNKEQLAKIERERKRQKQDGLMRQRKGEEGQLRAELEDKEQRHRGLEEAERERKTTAEVIKAQRGILRHRERDHLQQEEVEVKGARQTEILVQCKQRNVTDEKEQKFGAGLLLAVRSTAQGSGQQNRDSNLLGSSLPSRSTARVPSVSTDKQTHVTVGPAVPNQGHSSPSPRLISLNAGFTPGGPHKPTSHCCSQHHGTADVKNGGSDSGVSCLETPASPEVVEREDMGPMSYEISPYRESSDDEDEKPPPKIAKHIPIWARRENLKPQLLKQLTLDPDEIFAGSKTCSLKEVFGTNGSKKVQDFAKRSGSGDWVKDRVSWKEELQYKIDMGYMQKKYT